MIPIREKEELIGLDRVTCPSPVARGGMTPHKPCELRMREFSKKTRVLIAEKWGRMLGQLK